MSRQTISILVTGKVQGVFYRKSTKDKALMLGLTGEVSNLEDGSVLIIATGEQAQLAGLIEWCKQGPSRAVVDKVVTTPLALRSFYSFDIVR